MNDGDLVGYLEQLVEVLADHDDRVAIAGEVDEGLPDQPRRARIDSPRRLIDDEKLRASR